MAALLRTLALCQCLFLSSAQNVETRLHQAMAPLRTGTDFGRSLQAISKTLYASAPRLSGSGGMYGCWADLSGTSTSNTTATCDLSVDFGEGSIASNGAATGSSLVKVRANDKDYLVTCGNQNHFECSKSANVQRVVGECYSYDISARKKNFIPSPCPIACPIGISADIVFVIDGSGSVSATNYKKGLQWIADVLLKFSVDIDKRRVRVGFVPYDSSVYNEKVPVTSASFYDFRVMVTGLPYNHGNTNTPAAIRQATTFLTAASTRQDVAKLMITITDGQSTHGSPALAAQEADWADITMVAVGIGSNTDDSELQAIARDKKRVMKVGSYSVLDTIIGTLSKVIEETATVSLEGEDSNTTSELTSCQFGTSIHASASGLYVGAVGSYNRIGTVAEYDSLANFPNIRSNGHLNSSEIEKVLGKFPYKNLEEYFGYSVSSGKFANDATEWIVMSAPRYLLKGLVLVYRDTPSVSYHSIHPSDKMWQLGAYFGYSTLAIDVNHDGLDDLLVSAPLFSEKTGYDEGRVFVFLSDKKTPNPSTWTKSGNSPIVLQGENVRGARFGLNMVNGGDIDQNGIDDVIISSPTEESTGKNTQSGAIYVYFSTKAGLSEARKQKILGRSVSRFRRPLSQFGWDAVGGTDLDDNGYPDLAISAPSSEKVILLRSRKIITLNSEIKLLPQTLEVQRCAANLAIACSTVEICLSAFYQDGSETSKKFEMTYTIELDSLVPGSKRLRLLDSRGDSFTNTSKVGKTKTCWSYAVTLNTENLGKLSAGGGFAVTPRVTVNVDLSARHKATVMSGVLGYGIETKKSQDWAFLTGCGGRRGLLCRYDLVISVTGSDDSITKPIVLTDESRKLTAHVTIENKGPEYSYFTKLNVTSGHLSVIVVNGTCVTSVEDESKISTGLAVIKYKSNSSLLSDLMIPDTKCDFVIEFDFSKMKQGASDEKYLVEGILYSSAGANASFDINKANNRFSLSHPVQYESSIQVTEFSLPEAIYFNRTRNSTIATVEEIKSLEDKAFAGNNTGLTHQYSLYNRGPLTLSKSKVKLTWPEFTSNGLNLIYLIDIKCQPEEACVCDKNGKVNKFNINPKLTPLATGPYVKTFNVTYPATADAFGAITSLTCQNSRCSVVWCDMSPIPRFSTVKVVADFKPWIPSFGPDFTETQIFSDLDLIVANITPSAVATSKKVLSRLSTSPWYKEPTSSGVAWWIIFLAILGGLLLLVAAILIMWKAGFFESKYKNMTKEGRASVRVATEAGAGAPEDIAGGPGPEDPGMGRSTVDLVDGV